MAEYLNPKEFHQALVERRKLVDKLKEEGKEPPQISDFICKGLMDICNRLSYSPNFINYTYKDEMIDDAIVACIASIDKFQFDIISIRPVESVDPEQLKGKTLTGDITGALATFKSFNKKTGRVICRQVGDTRFSTKEKILTCSGYAIQAKEIGYSNAFSYFTQCANNAFINRINLEHDETIAKAAIFQSAHVNFLDIQDHDGDENYSNGYIEFMKSNVYLQIDVGKETAKRSSKKKKTEGNIEDLL